jgi:hypothetical protein
VWGISSGPATVVASGEVTSFRGHPVIVRIPWAEGAGLRVEFHFEDGPEPTVRFEPEADRAVFVLTGFTDVVDRGSAEPILVATADTASLYLHFRVRHGGRTLDRTLHFTAYQLDTA